MIDYKIGYVYMITDDINIYIGSTLRPIKQRWCEHKTDCKSKPYKLYKYMNHVGVDRFKIMLIKEYLVVDSKHLQIYEQLWINKYGLINLLNEKNILIPNKKHIKSQQKEYYQKNADKIKEYHIEYNKKNADKIKSRQKEYNKKNADKIKEHHIEYYQKNADKIKEHHIEYNKKNADKIKSRQKEYYQKNTDKIKEYYQKNADKIKSQKSEMITCECGRSFRSSSKAEHLRTKIHQTNLLFNSAR